MRARCSSAVLERPRMVASRPRCALLSAGSGTTERKFSWLEAALMEGEAGGVRLSSAWQAARPSDAARASASRAFMVRPPVGKGWGKDRRISSDRMRAERREVKNFVSGDPEGRDNAAWGIP